MLRVLAVGEARTEKTKNISLLEVRNELMQNIFPELPRNDGIKMVASSLLFCFFHSRHQLLEHSRVIRIRDKSVTTTWQPVGCDGDMQEKCLSQGRWISFTLVQDLAADSISHNISAVPIRELPEPSSVNGCCFAVGLSPWISDELTTHLAPTAGT